MGAFKLGHTHPEYSNSGLIALLAEAYAGAGKVAGLTLEDVRRPATARYVAGIESSIVHYGSSTGFFGKRMFEGGPGYLSAAVLYENMVIESYGPQYRLPFPVVAIYPKEGTFWSDHPVGVVEREWVTPEHREAAKAYIDYLLAQPQQEAALRYGFRPSAVEIPLAVPFDAAHGVDPKEPQTTLEVPSVEVIDAVLKLWRENKKRSDVTLVLDHSGSMREEARMENARAGAEQFVELLDPEDSFSFLTFNAQPTWVVQEAQLGQARPQVVQAVRGVFPDGGTGLYDAIALAYDDKLAEIRREPGRIGAIVVLTDGEDTDSRLSLADLLRKIRAGEESAGVRVFTIGYGSGARKEVLQRIADATRGRFYQGDPANIRTFSATSQPSSEVLMDPARKPGLTFAGKLVVLLFVAGRLYGAYALFMRRSVTVSRPRSTSPWRAPRCGVAAPPRPPTWSWRARLWTRASTLASRRRRSTPWMRPTARRRVRARA